MAAAILACLNQKFSQRPHWEMTCHRVAEYEKLGNSEPVGGLAAQRVFDNPSGVIAPNSKEAFDLKHAMNRKYVDALKSMERLFKQYTVA